MMKKQGSSVARVGLVVLAVLAVAVSVAIAVMGTGHFLRLL